MNEHTGKNSGDKKRASIDVILRDSIEQGIRVLYFDRKHLFHETSKDFRELSEAYTQLSEALASMVDRKPRLMIPAKNGFSYEIMTADVAGAISGFLDFILMCPPVGFRLRPRVKKYLIVGGMKVPALDYVLMTLLTYKVPNYWRDKIDTYYAASMAILKIVTKDTKSEKILEISSKIANPASNADEKKSIDDFYEKFTQWIRLGLIG